MKANITETIKVGGLTLSEVTITEADFAIVQEVSVPAGKVSQLTTRTNNTDGTITGPSGHGITTAQVVDLYWVGGCRRAVVVGTVASLAIPISGGSGDNLPTNMTAVTISARASINVPATGDKVMGIFLSTPQRGSFSLNHGAGAAVHKTIDTGKVWHWESGNGDTNPAAGVTLTTCNLSHDGTSTQKMKVVVLANN